jgi:hypothetical protein
MEAIICVTVVLPLLPVTAISGSKLLAPPAGHLRRAPAVCRPTTQPGRPASVSPAPPHPGDGRDGTLRRAWARKSVGVEALTLAAPRTGHRVAGCGCRCAPAARRPDHRPAWRRAATAADCSERHHAATPCAGATPARGQCSATHLSRSENGRRSPHRSPGSPRGPCRRSAPRRRACACDRHVASPVRAVDLHGDTMAARPAQQICCRITCGSSLRGLSLVSTTRSAACATAAPISGRLPGRGHRHNRTRTTTAHRAARQRPQGPAPAPGIGRVGVVDHATRGCPASHAHSMRPGTGVQRAQAARPRQRHSQRTHGRDHAQQVGHVVVADQRVLSRWVCPASVTTLKPCRCWCARWSLATGVPARRRARHRSRDPGLARQQGGQFGTVASSMLTTAARRPGQSEQPLLGLPVGLHRAVVVEVVLREVGEDGGVDAGTVQPVLGMPIDEASMAQAWQAGIGKISAGCPAAAPGRAWSGRWLTSPGPRPGWASASGNPTPSVPTIATSAGRLQQAFDSAWANHQAVEVLPLVPVTASTVQRLLGLPW